LAILMTPFPPRGGGVFTAGVLGVTPSVAGLVVLFLGWWKQWGIAPPAHLRKQTPLGAPPQAPNIYTKTEFHKPNV